MPYKYINNFRNLNAYKILKFKCEKNESLQSYDRSLLILCPLPITRNLFCVVEKYIYGQKDKLINYIRLIKIIHNSYH